MALQGPHQVAKQSSRTVLLLARASLYSSGLFPQWSASRYRQGAPLAGVAAGRASGSGSKHVRLEVVDGHLGRSVVKLAGVRVEGWSAEIASQRGLEG